MNSKIFRARAGLLAHRADSVVTQLLLPRRCPACDEIVTPYGELICPGCRREFKLIRPPYCMLCGKKLMGDGEYCGNCSGEMAKKHNFDGGRALYEYDSVANAIYRFKYGGRREYGEYFGVTAAAELRDFLISTGAQALIPIPLHSSRYAKRGFNQAEVFARAISKETGIPVLDKLLTRNRNTVPMKQLSYKMRINNLKNAFTINSNVVKLDSVIIIDDIYTTGATIDEASAVLKAAGIHRIYFLTLACGAGI